MAYYARKRKIGLPANHNDADADWIESQLIQLSPQNQLTAKVGYSDVYIKAYNDTPIEHQKSNRARRAANTMLRRFTVKCISARPQQEPVRKTEYRSDFNGF